LHRLAQHPRQHPAFHFDKPSSFIKLQLHHETLVYQVRANPIASRKPLTNQGLFKWKPGSRFDLARFKGPFLAQLKPIAQRLGGTSFGRVPIPFPVYNPTHPDQDSSDILPNRRLLRWGLWALRRYATRTLRGRWRGRYDRRPGRRFDRLARPRSPSLG